MGGRIHSVIWETPRRRKRFRFIHAACTPVPGILFNHESPLRPERFVTKKIITTAARIAHGSAEKLRLGNLEIQRDLGLGAGLCRCIWRILQQDVADDFVIATGTPSSLRDLVAHAFRYFGLDSAEHIEFDPALYRPSDIRIGRANPEKALRVLGWSSTFDVDQVIDEMCRSEA